MARPKMQFGDWKFDDLLRTVVQAPRAEVERQLKVEQEQKQKQERKDCRKAKNPKKST